MDQLRYHCMPQQLEARCANHFDRLQEYTLMALRNLPSQVIHNDAHYGNLLCATNNPEQLTGVIDFGDIIKRPLVVDLICNPC